jgi:predicted nucleic acid-binding protein
MWADTNILIRLVTKQPKDQFEAVYRLLEKLEKTDQTLSVHPVHVAEAIFVLEGKVYQYTPEQAAKDLLTVLSMTVFTPADEIAVINALREYPKYSHDFPDVFLAQLALLGDGKIISFEKKLRQLEVTLESPK